VKVLIVDDHPMVRKGLATTLSFEEQVEEIKEASSIKEAMAILANFRPEVMVVDLMLGKEDGLELVSKVRERETRPKCIVLTSSSRKDDFLRAQEKGVDGYILKEAFPEDIIYAFRVVARGKKFFDPELLEHKLNSYEGNNLDELTPREKEILQELGKGLSNSQIAKALYISENTVKKHISSILAKLGLRDRLEAALYINNNFKISH